MSMNYKLTKDEKLMWQCIELARLGKGYVSPNPLVGCVILKNGKIVSKGYHHKYGELHAEAEAIENAEKKGISLKGASLYVNLEPCVHKGKTGPCTDRIIKAGISKVFIGCRDPYKLVNGKGIAKLKKNGIEVTTGILEYECTELNKFFMKFVKSGMPYVTLKAAQTLDGKIADKKFRSKWISGIEARTIVHRLRAEYDAVLIGFNTLKYDNPSLNVRHVEGRDPYRIVIDTTLKCNIFNKIFKDKNKSKTIIITAPGFNKEKLKILLAIGITVIEAKLKDNTIDLKNALLKIANLNIASILVEGGAKTFAAFLNAGLTDELLIFTSPKIMGAGKNTFGNSEPIDFKNAKEVYYQFIGNDILTNIKL